MKHVGVDNNQKRNVIWNVGYILLEEDLAYSWLPFPLKIWKCLLHVPWKPGLVMALPGVTWSPVIIKNSLNTYFVRA